MTEVEKQAVAVAKAWSLFLAIKGRLEQDRDNKGRRPIEERRRDMYSLRPAYSKYLEEMARLVRIVL